MNYDSQVSVLIRYIFYAIVKYVVMGKWCQGSCAAYNYTFANIEFELPGIYPFR